VADPHERTRAHPSEVVQSASLDPESKPISAGTLLCCALALIGGCAAAVCSADEDAADQRNTPQTRAAEKALYHPPDLSAQKRTGKASFYAAQFSGKTMADGAKMNPQGDNAASKTLPLGTTAKVTNIETGKSAVVTIEDRGPYVPGRIVDLSPATARKLGITRRKGIAAVVVAPIAVPQPDGRIKLGVAAHERREADAPVREAANAEIPSESAQDTRSQALSVSRR
jgi:rare lipoprotein A